ncbi:PBP1A family penicillin-binding protein [Tetragenococcus muriaticus]|uniref:Multimodular transpeptidase-transglycosylase n=2 Tax=Tetragenococcus muriaticus TaxID=64642 RepID=A0A091C4V2_9ENTE|nr:PBP1A family penicillin-binding protein [Tetragenococcus muriaticus]KFN91147.1 multimodular transpeptidase-transglycosylase [Tetragenococcus muriaticus 3MR10-3]KFN91604.1 multimodular transpeptidase-transglycosylase [Tetragenococcus muriaticus PMC-11-5]GMA47200.1 peptidoglycan glycosyltransferase [Tetragenococcus muriaticus]
MANQSNSRVSRYQQKGPKNRGIGSIILKIFIALFTIVCVILIAGAGLFVFYAKDAPSLNEEELDATVSSKLYAADGEIFQDIGLQNREKISPTDIPQQLEDAIVSIEDRRFYNHIGVDPIRIVGSAFSNVTTGGKQGGSTLTQQLIKLSYFSTNEEDQTLRRKAQEAWLAVKLERQRSKQEILTYYINKVYMSNGFYGMQTASQAFYGKSLNELSLAQTALIAGMPNAPNYYDPYVNQEEAKERRDTVLNTMLDNEKITQQEYQDASSVAIDDGLQELEEEDDDRKYYDNYIKEVINEVEEKTGKDVYRDGLNIYTNLDEDAQKRLYDIVNSDEYVDYPDEEMQVASTLIEPDTGQVKAQIGGRNIEEGTILGNNLAVNTSRDFGSTVKPIVDYGPAFEFKQYSTARTIVDEPYSYTGSDTQITNWDNSYMGSMTLREALVRSRNIPAAKLFEDVGSESIQEFLGNLNIHYENLNQSNAISSNVDEQDGSEYGVSSLKMAAAYAALANGGTYYEPQYVNKIVYQDGSEEVEAFEDEGQKAMEDTTAYMVTDILKDVISDSDGTGSNAEISGLYQAGKTGTSNYTEEELDELEDNVSSPSPDSNFVGYTPNYSLAVWTGYNDKMTPVTSESSHVASDVYRELMEYVSSSAENEDWTMPNGLIRIGKELYLRGQEDTPSSSQQTPRRSRRSEPSSSSTPSSQAPSSTSKEEPSSSEEETTSESSSEPEEEPSSSEEGSSSDSEDESTPPSSEPEEEPSSSEEEGPPPESEPSDTGGNDGNENETGEDTGGNSEGGNEGTGDNNDGGSEDESPPEPEPEQEEENSE